MSEGSAPAAIHLERSSSEEQWQPNSSLTSERKSRFPRACTARARAKYTGGEDGGGGGERRQGRSSASSSVNAKQEKEERPQCSKIITPLVDPPAEAQLSRWSLRSMWELASLLDFLHMFRPLLNITVEFSAEELETALITPNSTLADIHIPLLKAIPPVTRMALGRATWVTVLCRKLRDWWHWVAEGELPIVASHGVEIETYKTLEPTLRVLILKALCDIRVEQEDIRSYIDNSLKHGVQLSVFRRERIGGDSHGVSYWYEDDPVIGHRLYREIRKIESKRLKGRGMPWIPFISCQWETVATNLEEFQEVSDKLVSSKNRTEASLGKKIKIDILPEVETIQKRKERTLKKQHRQALLLDSYLTVDGLSSGRSLRDRKPVTYTFDDFDRSINEAIKITKKRQASPEQNMEMKEVHKHEVLSNGRSNGPSNISPHLSYENHSPKFAEYEETDGENNSGALDRSNRQRKRPQRYSEKDFVEAVSDEAGFDSDDDIVGEAVYDDEYLQNRKQKKVSSGSEGEDEYSWERENAYDDEEADDSLSLSEDSDESHLFKKIPTRNRHGAKLRSVDEIQTGPRRSKRSTRPHINYRQYELSDSDPDSAKRDNLNQFGGHSDSNNELEVSMSNKDSDDDDVEDVEGKEMSKHHEDLMFSEEKEQRPNQLAAKTNGNMLERQGDSRRQRRFLDLNELAPSMGFDDGLSPPFKGENTDDSAFT